MKLLRKFAVQGHAVPLSVHSSRGPFPPEVLAGPKMAEDTTHSDSLHVGLDNVRFFRCRDCGEVLLDSETSNHDCEETH